MRQAWDSAWSGALYVGIGFAPAFTASTPYLVSSALAVLGLAAAAVFASRITLPSTGNAVP